MTDQHPTSTPRNACTTEVGLRSAARVPPGNLGREHDPARHADGARSSRYSRLLSGDVT
ncbi:MAG TPA: hypothetical protein VFO20_00260 [Propionibacteriaceae bacterium]|nr:hypothetical protein [Propionibacteriaceae bacterium]